MRANFSTRKFDVAFTEQYFKSECREMFRRAAIEFVQTATMRPPSLTGQARAALINVAKSIGVDPGVGEFDEPLSEYQHLKVPLELKGNTTKRGKRMGKSKLRDNKLSVTWTVELDITAAHNGFAYFTYWDNAVWRTLDLAKESAANYMSGRWTDAVKLRLEGWK